MEHRPFTLLCSLACVDWQVMELWTAGMVALMILPRLCLAAVAVVCLMSTREWMHPVVELVAHDVNAHPCVCARTAMRMELWTAGMAALTILPRLALASVAVVYLMLTREWASPSAAVLGLAASAALPKHPLLT